MHLAALMRPHLTLGQAPLQVLVFMGEGLRCGTPLVDLAMQLLHKGPRVRLGLLQPAVLLGQHASLHGLPGEQLTLQPKARSRRQVQVRERAGALPEAGPLLTPSAVPVVTGTAGMAASWGTGRMQTVGPETTGAMTQTGRYLSHGRLKALLALVSHPLSRLPVGQPPADNTHNLHATSRSSSRHSSCSSSGGRPRAYILAMALLPWAHNSNQARAHTELRGRAPATPAHAAVLVLSFLARLFRGGPVLGLAGLVGAAPTAVAGIV